MLRNLFSVSSSLNDKIKVNHPLKDKALRLISACIAIIIVCALIEVIYQAGVDNLVTLGYSKGYPHYILWKSLINTFIFGMSLGIFLNKKLNVLILHKYNLFISVLFKVISFTGFTLLLCYKYNTTGLISIFIIDHDWNNILYCLVYSIFLFYLGFGTINQINSSFRWLKYKFTHLE